jgi:tripartite-type tricarboxylate transporter receptor subunit TctC
MKPSRRSLFLPSVLLAGPLSVALSAALPVGAASADFPTKPIRLIVPFPPGGSNDVLSRYLGAKLTDRLHEQIVIDNRGGANGIIGAEVVANSAPDGYTLLFISTSWVMNAAVRPLPYDVEKSFDPIATVATSPNSIVVNPKGAYATLKDLVAQAKAKPGAISYAHTGVGGFNHFGGELFKKVAGINMVPIAYKGGGPAMIDVIAANVPVMFSSVTQTLTHVRAGRLKLLAVGSAKRSPAVPDVPTVAESGFPGYEVAVWWGMAAPTGTPRPVQEKIRRELTAVLDEPDTQKHLLTDAAVPLRMTPPEMRKMIHSDVRKWRDVAKAAGIKVK